MIHVRMQRREFGDGNLKYLACPMHDCQWSSKDLDVECLMNIDDKEATKRATLAYAEHIHEKHLSDLEGGKEFMRMTGTAGQSSVMLRNANGVYSHKLFPNNLSPKTGGE